MSRSYQSVIHKMRAMGHASGKSDEQINREIDLWKGRQYALADMSRDISGQKKKEQDDIFSTGTNDYMKYDVPAGLKSGAALTYKKFIEFLDYNGMNPENDIFIKRKFIEFAHESGINYINDYSEEQLKSWFGKIYRGWEYYRLFDRCKEIVDLHNEDKLWKYKHGEMDNIRDRHSTRKDREESAMNYKAPDFDNDDLADIYESIMKSLSKKVMEFVKEDNKPQHINELSLKTLCRARKKAVKSGDVELAGDIENKIYNQGDIHHIIKLNSGDFKELHLYIYWLDSADYDVWEYGLSFELFREEDVDEDAWADFSFVCRCNDGSDAIDTGESYEEHCLTPELKKRFVNSYMIPHLFTRSDSQTIAGIINHDTGANVNWRTFYTREPLTGLVDTEEEYESMKRHRKRLNEMSDALLDSAASAARERGDEERARRFEEYKNSPERPRDIVYADEVEIGMKISVNGLSVVFGVTDTEELSMNDMRIFAQVLSDVEAEVKFIEKDGKYALVDVMEDGIFVLTKGTLVCFDVDKDMELIRE